MSDLVSVIIPVFNRANIVEECLECVYAQIHRPIELLVVNDGSTDNSEDVILSFKEKHQSSDFQIEYIAQSNGGAPSARNTGLKNAKGKYIQFLDSDDLLYPNKIKDAVNVFNKDITLDLVYCGWFVSNESGKSKNVGPDLEKKPFIAEVVLRYLWTSAPLYKKAILDKTGFWNEKLTRAQDREYCARVMQHVNKAHRINSFDCEYRQFIANNSITSSGHKPNAKHPLSGWIANKVMRDLVIKENHNELLSKAIDSLTRRDLKDARRAIACGAPSLTRQILLNNSQVWKLGLKNTINVLFLFVLSLLPTFIVAPLVNYITRLKMRRLQNTK